VSPQQSTVQEPARKSAESTIAKIAAQKATEYRVAPVQVVAKDAAKRAHQQLSAQKPADGLCHVNSLFS